MTDVEVHASRVPRGVNLSEFYQARWKELYSTDGIFRSNVRCVVRALLSVLVCVLWKHEVCVNVDRSWRRARPEHFPVAGVSYCTVMRHG